MKRSAHPLQKPLLPFAEAINRYQKIMLAHSDRLLRYCRAVLAKPLARLGIMTGLLFIVIGIAMGFTSPIRTAAPEAETTVVSLALPAPAGLTVPGTTNTGSLQHSGDTGEALSTELSGTPIAEFDWRNITVQSGQTLDRIFRDNGYSVNLLHGILAINDDTKKLAKIRPGQVFQFADDESGEFQAMRVALNETQRITVRQSEQGLVLNEELRSIERHREYASGVISDSLFLSGRRAGLSDKLIMNLANIFGWDIDFVLDIREGDQFHLIYEKLYREGEFLRDGDILAAAFINQGEPFQAFRRLVDGQNEYFAPDGRNMRKSFLRAPLNFSYISSSFNPRRFHPILKRVKAHNGIDYRAPSGTPVYAAGEGKVIRSAYSKYNGHHVFIQHPNNIVTKYLHFTKRLVKNGQRVRQGQTIGTVGATGLAQAPHLHYEFVVNGVHKNPRTVNLPKAEPLPPAELEAFLTETRPLMNQLSVMQEQALLASNE